MIGLGSALALGLQMESCRVVISTSVNSFTDDMSTASPWTLSGPITIMVYHQFVNAKSENVILTTLSCDTPWGMQ